MFEGYLLRKYRKKKRVGLRETANLLNIDKGYLSRIENNKEKCSEDVRERLLNYYQVEIKNHNRSNNSNLKKGILKNRCLEISEQIEDELINYVEEERPIVSVKAMNDYISKLILDSEIEKYYDGKLLTYNLTNCYNDVLTNYVPLWAKNCQYEIYNSISESFSSLKIGLDHRKFLYINGDSFKLKHLEVVEAITSQLTGEIEDFYENLISSDDVALYTKDFLSENGKYESFRKGEFFPAKVLYLGFVDSFQFCRLDEASLYKLSAECLASYFICGLCEMKPDLAWDNFNEVKYNFNDIKFAKSKKDNEKSSGKFDNEKFSKFVTNLTDITDNTKSISYRFRPTKI